MLGKTDYQDIDIDRSRDSALVFIILWLHVFLVGHTGGSRR